MALTHTPALDSQFQCPEFQLPGVDGQIHSRQEFEGSAGLLVMFICNHCPYVKAIEDRLIKLGQWVKTQNLKMVAICANDAENYPEDSFENIKKRWTEKQYPFAYLFDESQDVARRFGAVCTPDFFVFDKNLRLAYRGRLDDSWKEPEKVTTEELKQAMEALLHGQPVSEKQVSSMGCNIKWKKS